MSSKPARPSLAFLSLFAIVIQFLCGLTLDAFGAKRKYGDSVNNSDALFDPGRVIQIEIRLDPKDWHELRVSHRSLEVTGNEQKWIRGYEYVKADVAIDGRKVKSVGVRKKGWGSAASTRPSFKINFDEYVKGQDFLGIDRLTLNNCLQDITSANQFLVYSFLSKAGVPAPRSNLAHVVVNGEDLGIYANVESIDKRFIKRHFGDDKGDLYEREWGDFTTNEVNQIEHKWGRDRDREHLRRLAKVLDDPAMLSVARVEQMVDVDAFITFWAAEVLSGCPDGYATSQNNYYLYRNPASGKFVFIPWGRDVAFRDFVRAGPKSVKAAGILCRRLWELPEIRERYRKEMGRLLENVWDEEVLLANLGLVQELCAPYRKQAESPRELEQLVQFVKSRRKEMQAELDGPAPDLPKTEPWKRPPPRPTGSLMEVRGSFSTTLAEALPSHPTNFFGHGAATMEFTVEGKTERPFTRFGAAAVPNQSRKQFTVIEVVAADAAGKRAWRLSFQLDPYLTLPGKIEMGPFALGTRLVQTDGAGELSGSAPGQQSRNVLASGNDRLWGTLELDQASRTIGGTIAGKFKINTTAFAEERHED